ncbi:MAG: flagellar basal body protein FliL [Methylococcaceae bacterium]|nr:flagellar basal body protein FliL [Methylococcaceae bacterium]
MAENEQVEGEGKKSSKLIIIIAVIVLLVGGGAGYYFMAGGDAEVDGEKTEVVEEAEEGEETEAANELLYYDLNQSLIVNFPRGSGASLIQVSISILVKGTETLDAIKKHEPMIRNNLLMAISAQGAANLKTREGKEALRETMMDEVEKVMDRMTKKSKVEDLFFTAFVMQ